LELVLDANEYIFGFGLAKEPSCEKLIDVIHNKYPSHSIRICEIIVAEVRHNLTLEDFRRFIEFISALTTIDQSIVIPFEIGAKYETKGFKPADAFIAAYTECVGADALVTENRHFLSRQEDLPFKVVKAEEILLKL